MARVGLLLKRQWRLGRQHQDPANSGHLRGSDQRRTRLDRAGIETALSFFLLRCSV